jgi:hypothetical protein
MTFDSVPWAVGGGASLSEGVGRMISYFMFQGAEGVLGATDLEVKALATPGGSVRISPGGCNIVGRAPGQLYESYLCRNTEDHVVTIDPNNTASARSDLVIARVEDPYVAGAEWSIPSNRAVGPYAFPRVVKSVPSTLRSVRELGNSWAALGLARIDIPALTSTITQGMIVPLRTKVSPPAPPVPPVTIPIPPDATSPDNCDTNYFGLINGPGTLEEFPSQQIGTWRVFPTAASWTVSIPSWANVIDCLLTCHNTIVTDDVWGEVRVEIGTGEVYSGSAVYDFNKSTGKERFQVIAGGRLTLPSSVRGKNKRFRMNAKTLDAAPDHPGKLQVDRGSILQLQVMFKEQC